MQAVWSVVRWFWTAYAAWSSPWRGMSLADAARVGAPRVMGPGTQGSNAAPESAKKVHKHSKGGPNAAPDDRPIAVQNADAGQRAIEEHHHWPWERPAMPDRARDGVVAELSTTAAHTRDGNRWNVDAPLSKARNAHDSNTAVEMRAALAGKFNWLEGDLRLNDKGQPVMAHASHGEDEGLGLDQWLEIGRSGERGMKVDVKETAAIPKVLDAVEKSGIPQGRIMLDVPAADVDDDTMRDIRRRLPNAHVAITPARDHNDYSDAGIDRAIELAEVAGGRVSFPLRWDMLTDSQIKRLRLHGTVSVWTDQGSGTPEDTAAETRRLRERGVDGVIDLGKPSSTREKLYQIARNGLAELVGDPDNEDPLRNGAFMAGELAISPAFLAWRHGGDIAASANAVAGRSLDLAGDGVHAVGNLAGGGLSAARKGASHIPVVGGLFG